ncbi:hypothetical protein ScPMuIL_014875 [Solemya velum]
MVRRVSQIIAATWIIPIIVSSPYVLSKSASVTLRSEYGIMSRQICQDTFDDIDDKLSEQAGTFRRVFFIVIFFITFLIPASAVLVTCIKIAACLMRPTVADSRRTDSNSSGNHGQHRRKVARMVIVIALAFIICWSPMYVVAVVSELQESSFLKQGNFIFTMLMVHLSGFVNSCINPIVYTIMSENYRQSFRCILARVLCVAAPKKFLQTQTTVSQQLSYVFSSTKRLPKMSECMFLRSHLPNTGQNEDKIDDGSTSSESESMKKFDWKSKWITTFSFMRKNL